MESWRRLARLLRHSAFRRLVTLRVASQGADAVVQVGMASYILFSPQSQPNAWAVAAVIAMVMMPFAVIAPFVSPILDRFSRQRIIIGCDLTRVAMAITMAILVGGGWVSGRWQAGLFILLIVTLGLNRLQLAALGAGMPFTVKPTEYLEAAAVTPMIGPLAAMIGGVLAAGIRFGVGPWLGSDIANAMIFGLAAALLAVAVWLCSGFERGTLGPRQIEHTTWRAALSGFSVAGRQLWTHRAALVSIIMVFGAKLGHGAFMTAIILMYRYYFHTPDQLDAAMVGMGVWFLASGLGYAAAGLVASPVSARVGVRNTIGWALLVAATAQSSTVVWPDRPGLMVAGLVLGLCAQSVKICADTVVQAHIADTARGRVMVVYDIVNNAGIAAGAVLGALVLPADGRSPLALLGLAGGFLVLGVLFLMVSRGQTETYDRGTVRAAKTSHG